MGLLSNKVEREHIKPGDHIYSWRALYTYAHHGIFVGGNKVIHFTNEPPQTSSSATFRSFFASSSPCPSTCGFRGANSGVVLSCLDCFLGKGSLYCYDYGVAPSIFIAHIRGGTCTTSESDPADTVVQRAEHLLQNGFGSHGWLTNNSEDFALYCKTGYKLIDQRGEGMSGQVSSAVSLPWALFLSYILQLLTLSPIGVAMTFGFYATIMYFRDVRGDVYKVRDVRGDVYKVRDVRQVAAVASGPSGGHDLQCLESNKRTSMKLIKWY